MSRSLPPSHRLGMLLLGPLLASLLTCSESFECGGSRVAFVLPRPGDVLELRAFVCVEPADDALWTIWASFDGDARIRLEVEDPVAGSLQDVATSDDDAILEGGFEPAHCDEGLRVVLRRESGMGTGAAAGWLYANLNEVDPSVCTSTWEREDEP